MSRINSNDRITELAINMSDGNPGALTCVMQTIKEGNEINPDETPGWTNTLLEADNLGIYGSNLYILWNDLCNRESKYFIALFTALDFGFISGETIKELSQDRVRLNNECSIDIKDIHIKVCKELPNFMR